MKVLFDQGIPASLRQLLEGHEVSTAYEKGWSTLRNGELLAAAEREFDVMITTDQNLRYQQNLADRKIAIMVLPTTSWPKLKSHAAAILATLNQMPSGGHAEFTTDNPA